MVDAAVSPRKTILPGIRGVLIAVLVYLIFQVLFKGLFCWIALFGFGQESDHLGAEFNADIQFAVLGWADYAVMALDVWMSFSLLAAWVCVLALFLGRKRRFLFWFLMVVILTPALVLLHLVLAYMLLGSAESFETYGGGTGFVLALAIYQALHHSPRTEAVFIN